jgi:hypothetical protein
MILALALQPDSLTDNMMLRLGVIGFVVFLIFLFTVVMLIPYWKILTKAGYSGALSLLLLLPLANVVILFWFAFTEWPLEKRLADLQRQLRPPNM